MWQKLSEPPNRDIIIDEPCYHARSYIIKGGYDAGETNQHIINIKISSSEREERQRHYRESVKQFCVELKDLLCKGQDICLTAIPPSSGWDKDKEKRRGVWAAVQCCAEQCNLPLVTLVNTETMEKARYGGPRWPNELDYHWVGASQPIRNKVVIIDDVITSGSHFRAMADMTYKHWGKGITVYGVFWAKAISKDTLSYS